MDQQLNQAYSESVEIIKTYSKTFYQGFKMLPDDKFLAVASLYAFFRTADDIADQEGPQDVESRRQQLDSLADSILSIQSGGQVEQIYTWWPAFEATVTSYKIPTKGFEMQIEGQKSDLVFQDIETVDDLIDYSRRVAGSVGRILLPILTSDPKKQADADLLTACENLGIAMQITNILRDVGEDLRDIDRVYIPTSLLKRHGLSKQTLIALVRGQASASAFKSFVEVWERLAKLSESYYDSFDQHFAKLDRDAVLPVYASSLIYREIMNEVRANNYNCLSKRQSVSHTKKLLLLEQARQKVNKVYANWEGIDE